MTSTTVETGIRITHEVRDTPDKSELEVIRYIAKGLKDVAIAHQLDVSVVTVRRRAQRFRLKVGAQNRAQAIAVAAANGWLSEDLTDERASGDDDR